MTNCKKCGRALTDPVSIARSYGPCCAMNVKRELIGQGDLFSNRSRYTYGISGDILWLEDVGRGAVKSLTNDIDMALADIKEALGDLSEYKIIYRDSFGIWDGVTFDAGRVDFYHIGEADRDKAFKKAGVVLAL